MYKCQESSIFNNDPDSFPADQLPTLIDNFPAEAKESLVEVLDPDTDNRTKLVTAKFLLMLSFDSSVNELVPLASCSLIKNVVVNKRHFKEIKKVDIIEDNVFVEANITFRNILQKIKASGKGDRFIMPRLNLEDLILLH